MIIRIGKVFGVSVETLMRKHNSFTSAAPKKAQAVSRTPESGFVHVHSQNRTVAARATADRKTFGH
ncbi:hypothetical protein E3D03_020560, partial [Paracoccus sp. DMF]